MFEGINNMAKSASAMQAEYFLYALAGICAAAAFAGLAIMLVRHFLRDGEDFTDAKDTSARGKRIIGFLFGVSFLIAAATPLTRHLLDHNPSQTELEQQSSSSAAPSNDLWLPGGLVDNGVDPNWSDPDGGGGGNSGGGGDGWSSGGGAR